MNLTICGRAPGWDIDRCRTVTLEEAMEAWGPWLSWILATTPRKRLSVQGYMVWLA